MKKRGISPLIATVLIIGFVIVLAALILTWGSDVYKEVQTSSEIRAQKALDCSRVNLDIKNTNIYLFDSKFEMPIENLGEPVLIGFIIRIKGQNGIESMQVKDELKLGELKKIKGNFNPLKTGFVDKIEVFPMIKINNEDVTCENLMVGRKAINLATEDQEIDDELLKIIQEQGIVAGFRSWSCTNLDFSINNPKTDFFNSVFSMNIQNSGVSTISGFSVKLIGSGSEEINLQETIDSGVSKNLQTSFNIVTTGLVNKVEVTPKVNVDNTIFSCDDKLKSADVSNYRFGSDEIEKIWKVWDSEINYEKSSTTGDTLLNIMDGNVDLSEVDYLTFKVSTNVNEIYYHLIFGNPLYSVGSYPCQLPGTTGGWDGSSAKSSLKVVTVNINEPKNSGCNALVSKPKSIINSFNIRTVRATLHGIVYLNDIYFYKVKK